MNELPTTEYLQECFEYNSETGECFWKKRDMSHFKDADIGKMWNTRFSGKLINGRDKSGKLTVRLDKISYPLHRLIFKMNYGIDPSKYLKHKDNNPLNNRLDNLYEDESRMSGGNRPTPKHNTSGLTGATYNKSKRKWVSEISYKGSRYYVGAFDTAEEANQAYVKASNELKEGTYHV